MTGSLAWRSQPSPKHSVSSARMGGAIHVGRCTALVTWLMGTSSVLPSGNISCHIALAITPWRWLTAFVDREPRIASGVSPVFSSAEAAWVRPSARTSCGSKLSSQNSRPRTLSTSSRP